MSSEGEEVQNALEVYAAFDGSIFMGVSGPYADTSTAIQKAVENCAKMIALNKRLTLLQSTDLYEYEGKDYPYFKRRNIGIYEGIYLNAIYSDLEIVEIRYVDNETGVIALAGYGESPRLSFNESFDSDGRPSWIDNPPAIPGYLTAVGVARQFYYFQDSLEAAAYMAAMSLLEKHGSTITRTTGVMATTGSSFESLVHEDDYNILSGFRILRYWYDGINGCYYALAVANEGD